MKIIFAVYFRWPEILFLVSLPVIGLIWRQVGNWLGNQTTGQARIEDETRRRRDRTS